MSTQAKLGYQTFLQREDPNNPGTFNNVIEILDIKGPGSKVDAKDATSMSSASGVREYIAGLEDPGQVQVTVNWVPGDVQHAGILSDKSNKTTRNWRIAFPAGFSKSNFAFAGFVIDFSPSYPIDDKIQAQLTIQITGPSTLN